VGVALSAQASENHLLRALAKATETHRLWNSLDRTEAICKEVFTRQETKQFIENGFEYVMDKEDVSLFRKLK
jgi:hypothetical protein